MAKIHKLPQILINKIAAGEVIERPASVVKELVENSIDAGATQIIVEVEEGGKKLIRISDDGEGMEKEDLPLALEAHATSKITDEKDLFSITSLGFRGEAISTITAVSELTISSCPRSGEGHQIGNQDDSIKPCAMTRGTIVDVRDLFSRTPARRKFLKSDPAEYRQILDTLAKIALSHCEISFVFKHNKKETFHLERGESLRERVRTLFNRELAESLIPIALKIEGYKIEGLAAPPAHSRKDTTWQYTFLNSRAIRDKTILSALRNSMEDVFMKGRHPVVFLFITLPPDLVDVNVHPRKLEVRFVEERKIYQLVYSALRERLDVPDLVPSVKISPPEKSIAPPSRVQTMLPLHPLPPRPSSSAPSSPQGYSSPPRSYPQTREPEITRPRVDLTAGADTEKTPQPEETDSPSPPEKPSEEAGQFDEMLAGVEQVFQIHNSYLIAEVPDGIRIIDQHALHEKILYVRMSQSFYSRVIETQSLLIPEEVEMSLDEIALFKEFSSAIHQLGFDFLIEEPHTLKIVGYPLQFVRVAWGAFFRDTLSDLVAKKTEVEITQERFIATLSCKGAIKQGQRLSPGEMMSLIQDALPLPHTYTCAHGRPTYLSLTLGELERMFKRK